MTSQQFDDQFRTITERLSNLQKHVHQSQFGTTQVNQELIEELTVAVEELRQQNEALVDTRLQVERERQRYAELFDLAPDAYIVTDQFGIISEANRAAASLLNRDNAYLVGKPLTIFIPQNHRYDFRTRLSQIARSEQRMSWDAHILPTKGERINVSITVAASRAQPGDAVLRWLIRDITEVKRTEDALRQMHLHLEKRVEERTVDLIETNQRLLTEIAERSRIEHERLELLEGERAARAEAERAGLLKLQFLAMISHELRTPLASIKGFSSTLMQADAQFDPIEQREFIGIIDQEADRLSELVDQLLNLSQIQAGSFRVKAESHHFNEVMEAAMTRLQMLAAAHHLRIDVPDDLPVVQLDTVRIAQVLINLVANAASYSPKRTTITISAMMQDDHLYVSVADQGPGIAAEERASIFEPFKRLEREGAATDTRGVGLGLAICKGIVDAHAGHIWIEDRQPPGTTVIFSLPV
jgi:PAS domain S-box-containing protein